MTPEQAAAAADLGRPTARKAGRDPRWPYVPVIVTTEADTGTEHAATVLGRAYATRAEAVAKAERVIAHRRDLLASDLADPRKRALRRHHGVTQP